MKKLISKAKSFMWENDILNFGKNNKTLVFMFVCLLMGVVWGSMSAGCINFETLDVLNGVFLNDFKERMTQNGTEVFVSSLSLYFIFALALELSALAVWGVVSVPLTVCFKGLGIGLSGGYLYMIYGLKGIAFYILILVPGIVISSIAFVLFGATAFKNALAIAKKIMPKTDNGADVWNSVVPGIKKLGYCTLLLCFSSFVDMCFMMMFSGFFSF